MATDWLSANLSAKKLYLDEFMRHYENSYFENILLKVINVILLLNEL